MSPHDQRVAIAEACGYTTQFINWCNPHDIPDYLNSLDAMHEAEKTLELNKIPVYQSMLNICMIDAGGTNCIWHLPASVRAEAFLRTIGKWTE